MSTATGETAPALRVPPLTRAFWAATVLVTPVGETVATGLDDALRLGPTGTTLVLTALLLVALGAQVTSRRCVPGLYWTTVLLTGAVGSLAGDELVDGLGVGPGLTALALALAAVLAAWRRTEGSVSLQDVVTTRRELFSWGAVLLALALGGSEADLLPVGSAQTTALLVASTALVAAASHLGLDPVVACWSAYLLARPLGGSLEALLAQDRAEGGLGLGTTVTGVAFLLAAVAVLARSGRGGLRRAAP